MILAVQPLGGPVKKQWLRGLRRALPAHVYLRLLSPRPLLKQAFHPTYRRYRAERLCRLLARWKPKQARYILGLTAVDISTRLPGFLDHAVFGLSDRGGPAAVLSTYRLNRLPVQASQRERLWRVLVRHEWGHLLGLAHCNNPRCVMYNAESQPARLLRMRPRLCRRCRKPLPDRLLILW